LKTKRACRYPVDVEHVQAQGSLRLYPISTKEGERPLRGSFRISLNLKKIRGAISLEYLGEGALGGVRGSDWIVLRRKI